MRHKRYVRHGLWAVALSAVLVFTAQSSRADEWYPGLPDPASDTSQDWQAASQGGLTYATRAKQWFRSPDAMVTFTALAKVDSDVVGDVRRYHATGRAYMVSPEGAPANYGYLPPITVRSVGFGLIPVEATVQVSQRRENGYPIASEAILSGADYYDPASATGFSRQVAEPTVVEDAFNVQILAVKVDGVDLALTGDCRTVTPAPVHMVGPGYTIPEPFGVPADHAFLNNQEKFFQTADPSTFFNPLWGGQLDGTITIPAFTGCTTASGDDLSALMTLSVSGPGNPISARIGFPCHRQLAGAEYPLAPGQSTPKSTLVDGWVPTKGSGIAGCTGTQKFAYPDRPDN
jgi:hypothetical protein